METINRIREEWEKAKYGMDMLDNKIPDWWLSKIAELLKSQKEEILKEIEESISPIIGAVSMGILRKETGYSKLVEQLQSNLTNKR